MVCFNECSDCGNNISEMDRNPIALYPNPSSTSFTIQSEEIIRDVKVIDATGRIIFQESGSKTNAQKLFTGNWESGIYWVVVNERYHQPLLKTE
jgi:hypothetical protein